MHLFSEIVIAFKRLMNPGAVLERDHAVIRLENRAGLHPQHGNADFRDFRITLAKMRHNAADRFTGVTQVVDQQKLPLELRYARNVLGDVKIASGLP